MGYNTQLHVGDKVRIKSKEWFDYQDKDVSGDIQPSTMYGFYFLNAMQQYCGNICTIKRIDVDGKIKLEEDVCDWNWEEWMFDLLEYKEETCQRYYEGDQVQINSIDWYNNNKNEDNEIAGEGFIFNADMKEYCGKICTIDACHKDFNNADYYMLKGNGYSWSPWMFSLVNEIKEEQHYKVGDKIRIKPKEWFDKQDKDVAGDILDPDNKGIRYFFNTMKIHCGDVCTIEHISYNDSSYVAVKENDYVWEPWMFDIVKDEYNYKIGDTVLINYEDWYNDNKDINGEIIINDYAFDKDIAKYCGKKLDISRIVKYQGDILYYVNNVNFALQPWMFSLVKESTNYGHNIGDKVQINSKEWYDSTPKNDDGFIEYINSYFTVLKSNYCGCTATICEICKTADGKITYGFEEIPYIWMSWMFKLVTNVMSENTIEIGDLVKNANDVNSIVIGKNALGNYILSGTNFWDYAISNKNDTLTIIEKGKYKDLIDTKLTPETMIKSLRNRFGIIKACEAMREDAEAESKEAETINKSSKFNLTKIMNTNTEETYNIHKSKFNLTKIIL